MFYEIEVQGHIRVEPRLFGDDTKKSVKDSLVKMFDGFISKDLGIVVEVIDVTEIGEGIVIPGDGAAYYATQFKLLCYKPEVQEVTLGKISDITDFGAFINIGPIDGMIHVSQSMDDYVSFSKSNVLTGKESKRTLKVGDPCRARIVSISFKDISNPKIGLTMRQHRLGALSWIEEELKKEKKSTKDSKVKKKVTKK